MSTLISIDKLRLKFPGDKDLLFNDLSISFNKGEKVLLLGPSGCGKSTLLQVLSSIVPAYLDLPMKYEAANFPESWGFVFQDPETQFCMPYVDEEIAFVLENLQIPREQMNERIESILSLVGLELASSHTSIQSLSGGMKQRLAIASVLALDPEVLFFDEPTAMLDPVGTEMIWETVKTIAADKTVIIVEHKIEHVIGFINRVIVFNDRGEIIADGDPELVFPAFKKKLRQYGIWYPGAWEEFISSRTKISLPLAERPCIMELEDFKVYRHKEVKITIEKASAREGDWITILGANGAGKSTLLLSLVQLLKTSGCYSLNGRLVNKDIIATGKIAFVFQNPEFQFVAKTVFEELSFSLKQKMVDSAAIDNKVSALLSTFMLRGKKDRHPFQLSVGQKRRLSVATAFTDNPRVILLDEPTFGQDSKNTFGLLEFLEKERQNGAVIIMATHDPNITGHFATKTWRINNRALIEEACIKNHTGELYAGSI